MILMNININLEKIYTPQEIVNELDRYIIGQNTAKKAVAISLRNRYRRMNTNKNIINDIIPKNILMMGSTGIGKTEIARRLAILYKAPFIKVEATRFTEVGYVGRDVESIIRDLVEIAMKTEKKNEIKKINLKVKKNTEERILNAIFPIKKNNKDIKKKITREILKKKLRDGFFHDKEIELEISNSKIGVEIMTPSGMEEMTKQLQGLLQNISSTNIKKKKIKIKNAFKLIEEEEEAKLINEEDLRSIVIKRVEQYGIVFIDEIDKLTQSLSENNGRAEISREGVQRDLLPLIEGANISTKYGTVKTDHILFFASGSFHMSKPSDLLPELQGRLPIQIQLESLTIIDFMRILIEPVASVIKQHQALLETEEINLKYERSSIKKIAEIAWEMNEKTENIGARRLHTVMEYLLEDISFNANKFKKKTIKITEKYVNKKLQALINEQKLDQFIL